MGYKICEEREKVKKKNDKYFDSIMSGLIMVTAFIVFAVAGWDSSHREFIALMFGMFGELFAGIFLSMANISSSMKKITKMMEEG